MRRRIVRVGKRTLHACSQRFRPNASTEVGKHYGEPVTTQNHLRPFQLVGCGSGNRHTYIGEQGSCQRPVTPINGHMDLALVNAVRMVMEPAFRLRTVQEAPNNGDESASEHRPSGRFSTDAICSRLWRFLLFIVSPPVDTLARETLSNDTLAVRGKVKRTNHPRRIFSLISIRKLRARAYSPFILPHILWARRTRTASGEWSGWLAYRGLGV